MSLKPVQHQFPVSGFRNHVSVDRERRSVATLNLYHLARSRNPSRAGQAVVRRMDGIACLLCREVRNVEIDPWLRLGFGLGLRLARVFVIAYQKLARPEDVEGLLVEHAVGSLPTVNLEGQRTKRRSRRKILAARMGLEHERRGQHDHSRNPEAK